MTQPMHGRHRRLGPFQKVLAATGSAVLVIVALVVGQLLIDLGPDTDASHAPFLIAGKPGDNVDARTFDVELISARYASAVRSGGADHDSSGVWVILKIRLNARTESLRIGYAALVDKSGRTYLASDRVRQTLVPNARALQPGIPVEGEVAFEIPRDAIAGASVQFAKKSGDRRMDAMATIELPGGFELDTTTATLAPSQVVKP